MLVGIGLALEADVAVSRMDVAIAEEVPHHLHVVGHDEAYEEHLKLLAEMNALMTHEPRVDRRVFPDDNEAEERDADVGPEGKPRRAEEKGKFHDG